jgi:hypothetical protein
MNVAEPNDLNAWLRGDHSGGTHEATLHLTAEAAWQLMEQLEHSLANHYHGDARPGHGDDLSGATGMFET